jgi:hypothetical protein
MTLEAMSEPSVSSSACPIFLPSFIKVPSLLPVPSALLPIAVPFRSHQICVPYRSLARYVSSRFCPVLFKLPTQLCRSTFSVISRTVVVILFYRHVVLTVAVGPQRPLFSVRWQEGTFCTPGTPQPIEAIYAGQQGIVTERFAVSGFTGLPTARLPSDEEEGCNARPP